MDLQALIKEYGLITVATVWVIHQIVRGWSASTQAVAVRSNVDSKQDETITGFAVDFNAERKELQSELSKLQIEQGREAGRREQLEQSLIQERKETRERERETDKKLFEFEAQLKELQKARDVDQQRITELETQQIQSQNEIARRDVEINLLQAQKRELETLLERETNRANSLSGLVDKINNVEKQLSNTQSIPDLSNVDIDDTLVPDVTSAASAAEETK